MPVVKFFLMAQGPLAMFTGHGIRISNLPTLPLGSRLKIEG